MAHNLLMPRLSQEMDEGTIAEWLKREGDVVTEGEPIIVIESDKAELELPAPASGVVRALRVARGDTVSVGTILAIIAGADEPIDEPPPAAAPSAPSPERGSAAPTAATAERPPTVATVASPPAAAPPTGGRVLASPVARRIAAEAGIDLDALKGTGPDGLVTEADVRAFVPPSGAPPAEYEVIPLVGRRRRAAERLAVSRQTAADVTTILDVDMTGVAEQRKHSRASYTAFVAWAVAQSLRDFPILNSSLVGDEIRVRKTVDLGVAVALDDGLVVPVVRRAEEKSVAQISAEIDESAARARDGDLGPTELSGSSFTLTNSGSLGSLMFTPIINQPEVAILGMGKVADTPIVRDGEITIRKVMYLCLAYDHRVVEGADAVRFLGAVKKRLEAPGA